MLAPGNWTVAPGGLPTGTVRVPGDKSISHRAALLGAALIGVPLPVAVTPAQAQWTVFDPWNYAQNILSAARALDQINNQIQSLTNEAQMLVNQARNLASLPYSSLQQLQRSVQRTQSLLQQAQRVAYDVQDIDRAFTTSYGAAGGQSNEAMIRNAQERWATSVGALQDALRVQAGVVGNIDTNRAEMAALVTRSNGATGALQAAQAGNQLLALQSQQLADIAALLAALCAGVMGYAIQRGATCTVAAVSEIVEQHRATRLRSLLEGVDAIIWEGGNFTGNVKPVAHALTDTFGNADSKNSFYLDLSASFDVGGGVMVTPHVGHQKIKGPVGGPATYTDYSLSVAKDFGNGLTGTLTVVGTDAKESFYTLANKFNGKSGVVAGLKYSF